MILPPLEEIGGAVVWVASTFVVFQVVTLFFTGLARRAGAKPGLMHAVRDLFTLVWGIVAVTGVLNITGLTSEFTTLTVSGILGIALSLALQSTLSNVIAGILLFHDKAIRLGDEIQFSGIRGVIVQIAFRSTWVKTKEGNVVIIGNNNLLSGPLVNYSSGARFKDLLGTDAAHAPAT